MSVDVFESISIGTLDEILLSKNTDQSLIDEINNVALTACLMDYTVKFEKKKPQISDDDHLIVGFHKGKKFLFNLLIKVSFQTKKMYEMLLVFDYGYLTSSQIKPVVNAFGLSTKTTNAFRFKSSFHQVLELVKNLI